MANAFRFRLQPILKLRQHRENERKRTVAGTLREIADLQEDRGRALEQIDEQIDVMRTGRIAGTINLPEVSRRRYWLTHLQRAVLELDASIRTLRGRLAQERAELGEAATQRKILTTLADRQRERFVLDRARVERKEADEIATGVFRRNALASETADR